MNKMQIFADALGKASEGAGKTGVGGSGVELGSMVSKITSAIFLVLGIVAVFVIILGGFNMMTSSGDPGKVKKGKDTILWGIIGLIIAILSYAIVSFVLKQLQ